MKKKENENGGGDVEKEKEERKKRKTKAKKKKKKKKREYIERGIRTTHANIWPYNAVSLFYPCTNPLSYTRSRDTLVAGSAI